MLKKISFFLSVFVVMLSAAYVHAYEPVMAVSNPEIGLLTELGIFEESANELADDKITRGEFAKALSRLIGYNNENYIEYLAGLGVMSGDGNGEYRENDSITGNEALKMLVVTLGYDISAKQNGGYPVGYYTKACEIDITDRSFNGTDILTFSDAAELFVNAGNTSEADVTYNAGNLHLTMENNKTLFYKYHNIKKCEGIVTADEYTDFDGGNGVYRQIVINGLILEVTDINSSDYLGYCVEAYYYCTDTDATIRYIYPVARKNSTVVLNRHNECKASGDLQSFTVNYYTTEGKQKKLSVKDYFVFRNGKYHADFALSDIDSLQGLAEFMDNDGDGIYEVIKISEYENYIVEAVDIDRGMVFAKYGKSISLEDDNTECRIYNSDNICVGIEDIPDDCVLSVLKSNDGSVITAYIIENFASGTVESVLHRNGDKTVSLQQGRTYVVSRLYDIMTHIDKIEPEPGHLVQLKMDILGEIADISFIEGNSWRIGYVTGGYFGEEIDESIRLKLFTERNVFENLYIREKVIIDGVLRKYEDIKAPLFNSNGKVIRQLVRYKQRDGYIVEIDTPLEDMPYNTVDSLAKADEIKDTVLLYDKASKFFYSGAQSVVGCDDDTLIFIIPPSDAYYDEDSAYLYTKNTDIFGTMSYNDSKNKYIEAYNVDEAGRAKVIIRFINRNGSPSSTSDLMLVEQVRIAVDTEGEVCDVLEGTRLSDGKKLEMYVTEGAYSFTPKYGDIIRYTLINNKIWKAVLDYDYSSVASGDSLLKFSDGTSSSGSGGKGTYSANLNVFFGKMCYADDTHLTLALDTDGTQKTFFRVSDADIYLCDVEHELFEKITTRELDLYTVANNSSADVHVVTKAGVVVSVVVYTNHK